MSVAVRVLAGIGGVGVVVMTLLSAIRAFVLPRAAPSRVGRLAFVIVATVLRLRAPWRRNADPRESWLALRSPLTVLVLPVIYVTGVIAGYTLLFIAAGVTSLRAAFTASGSSLTTLGFAPLDGTPQVAIAVSEATIGLGLVALVISYLPTMYSAFQRREAAVSLLEVRAGSPPSAVEMLIRFHRIGWLDELDETWEDWEAWFADIEESHTSLPAMPFFRSPKPERHWIPAAGTVLDAASLIASTVDVPRSPEAELCIRAGYIALRSIADLFDIVYDADPRPDDPIAISRDEFDEACDQLAAAGVPLRRDLDQAWVDFAGWRVNYDGVLLALAALTDAPRARWASDRSRVDAPSRLRPGGLAARLRLRR